MSRPHPNVTNKPNSPEIETNMPHKKGTSTNYKGEKLSIVTSKWLWFCVGIIIIGFALGIIPWPPLF